MSDRADWLSTLSTEELLFMRKAYDVIHQSMCWTIDFYRAAGEISRNWPAGGN